MRRLRWTSLLLVIAACTAPEGAEREVAIPYESFSFDNGLTFLVNQDRSVPVIAVDVWYHVGSGYEEQGRSGFAHLFEHLMFEGSRNVPEGEFDNLLESAGGVNNGSTNTDRTNYFEIVPSNALELAMWLEADRMGGLLADMSQDKLDIQRDVVKNERRQSYENRPYGMFWLTLSEALYPEGHPYSWPTIGSMDDLSAAELADVDAFFRRYYAPNNAVVTISGDVDPAEVREVAERMFAWIPAGEPVERPSAGSPEIPGTRYLTLEDRVTLPQVNLVWRAAPAYSDDSPALDALADILGGGKNSRLYKRLVYDEQRVQSVSASNWDKLMAGDFMVRVTARVDESLTDLEAAVLEEVAKLATEAPTDEELARVVNGVATRIVSGLETAIGRAERLQRYYYYTGEPDYAAEELARYRALTPADVQAAAARYLDGQNRIVISVVPLGAADMAAGEVGS